MQISLRLWLCHLLFPPLHFARKCLPTQFAVRAIKGQDLLQVFLLVFIMIFALYFPCCTCTWHYCILYEVSEFITLIPLNGWHFSFLTYARESMNQSKPWTLPSRYFEIMGRQDWPSGVRAPFAQDVRSLNSNGLPTQFRRKTVN